MRILDFDQDSDPEHGFPYHFSNYLNYHLIYYGESEICWHGGGTESPLVIDIYILNYSYAMVNYTGFGLLT